MNANNKIISNVLLVGTIAVLTGCAATQTALEHRTLEVSTKQSETIFLYPVLNAQKTVYVSVKNTSDEKVDIAPQLKTALSSHGYKVINNPNSAHYLLQTNVLKVGEMSVAASQGALGGGYGSALAGSLTGAAVGSLTNQSSGVLTGGLAGGMIGLAADWLVKEVNYTLITDVQISEKVGKGGKVHEAFEANLANGSTSKTIQTSIRSSEFQRYRTRIASSAEKVNLKFADAKATLE